MAGGEKKISRFLSGFTSSPTPKNTAYVFLIMHVYKINTDTSV